MSLLSALVKFLADALAPPRPPARTASETRTASGTPAPGASNASGTRPGSIAPVLQPGEGGYPGDFAGVPTIEYAPREGRTADPGEVVWAWVPYEEDHGQGKDRPVLIIGRDRSWLLGLPLTSQDHDRDAAQEAAAGRYWVDLGSGPWDASGRPSEARVNRIVRIDPASVRRIGARLDERRFAVVADAVRRHTS